MRILAALTLTIAATTATGQTYPIHDGVLPLSWLDEKQLDTCREEGERAEYVMQRRQADTPMIEVVDKMQADITSLVKTHESREQQRAESFFLSQMLDLLMEAYALPRAATAMEADLAAAEFRDRATVTCVKRAWDENS